MTTSAGEFVKLVTAMTESVSRNEISASEAVTTLRRSLVDNFDFSVEQPIWYWANQANDLLAEMLPEKADVFSRSGDRSGPKDAQLLGSERASSIVIRAIMRGLKLFDPSESRRHGASCILVFCPNPIEESSTPFADAKSQWNHTHVEPGEEA